MKQTQCHTNCYFPSHHAGAAHPHQHPVNAPPALCPPAAPPAPLELVCSDLDSKPGGWGTRLSVCNQQRGARCSSTKRGTCGDSGDSGRSSLLAAGRCLGLVDAVFKSEVLRRGGRVAGRGACGCKYGITLAASATLIWTSIASQHQRSRLLTAVFARISPLHDHDVPGFRDFDVWVFATE